MTAWGMVVFPLLRRARDFTGLALADFRVGMFGSVRTRDNSPVPSAWYGILRRESSVVRYD